MMHGWKKYFKKRLASLLCVALMLGCVPAASVKAEDTSETPGWGNVKLQIEGEVTDSGSSAKVKLSVKNTDAFKDVSADLQKHITYYWFFADSENDLPDQNPNNDTPQGKSYELKGTDLTNGNKFIQVKAIYGGEGAPTDGFNGVYPYGESRGLEVKDGSLKVDAIAGVTVKGSEKGAQNGSIEVETSNNDLQYYYKEQPEDVKDFDNWKLEGLSENQEIGVKYKKNPLLTTVLNEFYAVYTIPLEESQSSVGNPTTEPDPTNTPGVTTEPTKVPAVTTEPTKVPAVTTEPTKVPAVTTEPTKVPAVTTEPTKVPAVTTEPTEVPKVSTDPTEVPKVSADPTKAPGDDAKPTHMPEPSPGNLATPGVTVTVSNNTYVSNGSGSVSFAGTKTNKKTVTVPDNVTINGIKYPVTTISTGAFSGSKVQNVKLGSNVKTVGKKAFKNCKSLKKVAFSNKITTVSSEAFSGCAKLGSVSLPSSVNTVGAKAFKNCKKLKKFTLGKKPVKTKKGKVMFGATGGKKVAIGASALENCLNLRSVIINSQVTKIGNNTFRNCKKLASMLVKSLKLKTVGNRALKGVSNCKISVPTIRLKKYRTLFTNKGQGKKVVIAKV